jgi:hypothetical protein
LSPDILYQEFDVLLEALPDQKHIAGPKVLLSLAGECSATTPLVHKCDTFTEPVSFDSGHKIMVPDS